MIQPVRVRPPLSEAIMWMHVYVRPLSKETLLMAYVFVARGAFSNRRIIIAKTRQAIPTSPRIMQQQVYHVPIWHNQVKKARHKQTVCALVR
jgi:hypothetical protein